MLIDWLREPIKKVAEINHHRFAISVGLCWQFTCWTSPPNTTGQFTRKKLIGWQRYQRDRNMFQKIMYSKVVIASKADAVTTKPEFIIWVHLISNPLAGAEENFLPLGFWKMNLPDEYCWWISQSRRTTCVAWKLRRTICEGESIQRALCKWNIVYFLMRQNRKDRQLVPKYQSKVKKIFLSEIHELPKWKPRCSSQCWSIFEHHGMVNGFCLSTILLNVFSMVFNGS